MKYIAKFTDRFLEDTKKLKGNLKKQLEKAVRKKFLLTLKEENLYAIASKASEQKE